MILEPYIGWMGVGFGLLVAPAQLYRIIRTRQTRAISTLTYVFLNLALVCYLLHAINIADAVFITAQAVNLAINGAILYLLVRWR